MERRDFLATSACALAGIGVGRADPGPSGGDGDQTQVQKNYAVKLTVLKRGYEKQYADAFLNGQSGPCPKFKDGQEFVIPSQWLMPAGMCEWAWGDIRTYIHDVFLGGKTTVGCCTDGFRPVFFKIERVDA